MFCAKCKQIKDGKTIFILSECSFVVKAAKDKDSDDFVIIELVLDHSCGGSSRQRNVKFDKIVASSFVAQCFVPSGRQDATQLQRMIKRKENIDVNYQQCLNIVKSIKQEAPEVHFTETALLHNYFEVCRECDPNGTYLIKEENHNLDYLYNAFGCAKHLWKHSRRVLCTDGTHVKTCLKGTLLTATVKDANNHSRLLAFMYCPIENSKYWTAFYKLLIEDFEDIRDCIIMSDRDKGGDTALDELGLVSATCVIHLVKNLKNRPGGGKLAPFVWMLANASSISEHKSIIAKMKKKIPKVLEIGK